MRPEHRRLVVPRIWSWRFEVAIAVVPGILVSAWLTHVVRCFRTGEWGFLVAGALFFPVAVVHGIGVWFGFW